MDYVPYFFKIQSPVRFLPHDARSLLLLILLSRWWDSRLIHSIFNTAEAALICSIPVSPGGGPDKLIWRGNSSGMFSVRSAYHLAKERVSRDLGESSDAAPALVFFWKHLWKLRIPGVVKNFIWRASHNLLPTKVNLHKKKIVPDSHCPLCGIHPESTEHILWECDSSTAIWMECSHVRSKSFL
jgi:hypothetical protein